MDSNLTKRDGLKRQGLLRRHLRWLSPSLVALVVVVLFGAAAPAAKADSYSFTMTDTSQPLLNITFSIPSTFTPDSYPDSGSFQTTPTSFTLGGTAETPVPVSFWNSSEGGGLIIGDYSGNWIADQGGDQLFTGTSSAPTGFILGTFDLTDLGGASITDNYTLTITDPPTVPAPEPSSLLLLGVGLLGMSGLIAYQQKKQGQLLEAKAADSI